MKLPPGSIAAPDFVRLSHRRLERMADGGVEVLESLRVLLKTEDNVVGEVLRGHGAFAEWEHFPPDDVYDAESHAQYYYHAHPPGGRAWPEHGHFHLFIRAEGMPKGIWPAPLGRARRGKSDHLCHLVAVSMDAHGFPTRLFTTNRWVTAETWYWAGDVVRLVDRFVVDQARPSWPANRWLGGMVQLFHPQIVALIRARDTTVERWRKAHPRRNVFEDRRLEVTSSVEISIHDQIAAVQRALAEKS
ncbi:MAG: hypothetical protein HY057_15115 [Rhodospirillales bacterium]|nr:hypothetical protein [Rhodospirillales bacterium]